MAQEPQKPTEDVVPTTSETPVETPPPAAEEVVTATATAAAAADVSTDKDVTPVAEDPEKPAEAVAETAKPADEPAAENKISQSVSFKEETNVVSELPELQKKALDDLKQLIQEALNKHEFTAPPVKATPEVTAQEDKKPEEEKKTEETKSEEKKEEVTEEKKEGEVVVEEKKVEEEKASSSEEPKTEAKPEPEEKKVEETVVEVVEKIASSTEEDGAKTVEAIQESIVSVAVTNGDGEQPVAVAVDVEVPPSTPEEVEIWGIPLLADERSDVILLKFLRARDFKVKEAFTMIKQTVLWRKEFGIEALLQEDLGTDWDKVVFTDGYDKEGHPVYYNVFGEFENKELYQKSFSDDEKRNKFIRWRIQSLEKSVRKLDFAPSGIATIVQINDLKNSPGFVKKELRQATNQALQLLQDNYPEFVAKQIFINVPWWYLAFSRMISPFLTQRTKSKFVFAGSSKSADTLFKYIAPELVPVQYGGLSREGEQEFTTADPATEVIIKPATKHAVEFPISEKSTSVWEIRVVDWNVSYGAEFVPSAEDGYTVIVQKNRKISPADETVITNTFKIGEPGKVVLTIDNQTSKKKKLLYRSKTIPISE
ncbi:patellin-3-like [Vicia villosa]|uniref:patellin-3-like n=1 Tax=Vicia villosa TaxID=3911 RepID=UPI00273AEB6F|nr:patellin-3-like [Vicia villosa]